MHKEIKTARITILASNKKTKSNGEEFLSCKTSELGWISCFKPEEYCKISQDHVYDIEYTDDGKFKNLERVTGEPTDVKPVKHEPEAKHTGGYKKWERKSNYQSGTDQVAKDQHIGRMNSLTNATNLVIALINKGELKTETALETVLDIAGLFEKYVNTAESASTVAETEPNSPASPTPAPAPSHAPAAPTTPTVPPTEQTRLFGVGSVTTTNDAIKARLAELSGGKK